MEKKFWLPISIFFIFLSVPISYSDDSKKDVEQILDSAEVFFKSLVDKKFETAWQCLTQKSQEIIVKDVYTASKNMGVTYPFDQIKADFAVNGFISRSYWNGFLKNFNPSIVLDECVWEKVLHKKDYAEIVIRYKKSENPFNLKMYKENNTWKVGLTETFWREK